MTPLLWGLLLAAALLVYLGRRALRAFYAQLAALGTCWPHL